MHTDNDIWPLRSDRCSACGRGVTRAHRVRRGVLVHRFLRRPRSATILQAELRAARAASGGTDERALRKWAAVRITGLADAMAGRRNERVRRVIASYIDEIVVYPRAGSEVQSHRE